MRAATVGHVAAAGAPLLAVLSLGGGDAIDDTSVHVLLEVAFLSPEEVEQLRRAERRKLAREKRGEGAGGEAREGEAEGGGEGDDRAPDRGVFSCALSGLFLGEKEEEEETSSRWPRSLSSSAVACSCSSRCVPFFRWQAQMPGFLVAALVVDSASGLCKAGIAGISPRAVFHSVVIRPAMLGIMACLEQKNNYALGWFLLVTILLVLCSLFVFAPKMLGILVDMDQKDSFGDVGKDCALALLGVVLVFTAACCSSSTRSYTPCRGAEVP